MKTNFLLFIFISLTYHSLFSQEIEKRKYSNDFLDTGVGAKSFGMANATTANCNDISSAYFNPAGLTKIETKINFSLMHASYFADLKYDYLAGAYKINDSSVIAFSLIRLGIDDIPNTLSLKDENGQIDFDRISYFSVADYAALISYAQKSKINGLSYGGSAKIIYRQQGSFANAYGFGLDFGLQYQKNKWHFAFMGKDIVTTFNAWTYTNDDEMKEVFQATGNELPENDIEITVPTIVLAVARDFQFTEKIGMSSEIDAIIYTDGKRHNLINSDIASIDGRLGIEANYMNIIFLRTGIGNFQETTTFNNKTEWTFQASLGLGIKYKNFAIDYALYNIGESSEMEYANIFSVSYSFDNIN